MTTGWMIGVMVEAAGERAPVRHFFAVAHQDRAKAEWSAVDQAMLLGAIAASPVGGLEPVQAIAPLSADMMRAQCLAGGQVRALGPKWPRRWIRP